METEGKGIRNGVRVKLRIHVISLRIPRYIQKPVIFLNKKGINQQTYLRQDVLPKSDTVYKSSHEEKWIFKAMGNMPSNILTIRACIIFMLLLLLSPSHAARPCSSVRKFIFCNSYIFGVFFRKSYSVGSY